MSYTIDSLLGFYAVKSTKECEEFLDLLEIVGAEWPDGKPPRAGVVDYECVSLDAFDRNIGHCSKKYYEENGYKLFIPESISKCEQWTVYNNTLPLCELTDEQAAMLFNAWRRGLEVEYVHRESTLLKNCETTYEWSRPHSINWGEYIIYRIKSKSERELFIGKSLSLMTPETERTMEQMFGTQFDAGARYKDLTQYFGENI